MTNNKKMVLQSSFSLKMPSSNKHELIPCIILIEASFTMKHCRCLMVVSILGYHENWSVLNGFSSKKCFTVLQINSKK